MISVTLRKGLRHWKTGKKGETEMPVAIIIIVIATMAVIRVCVVCEQRKTRSRTVTRTTVTYTRRTTGERPVRIRIW